MTYVRNSKFVSLTSLQVINFMANCVVELYGLEFSWSYQHAFVYIRQLAIHLRNALHLKTKVFLFFFISIHIQESNQNIYNWQFINSLKVWTLVLTTHINEELKPLIYPLVQIICGVIRYQDFE